MANHFQCDIVSTEREIFSGLVQRCIASGQFGDLGIYPGHAPLLTNLQPGPVRLMDLDGHEDVIFVSGGFLEVQPGGLIILSDTAVRAAELDEAAALKAKQHAEELMNQQKSDIDYARASMELMEAIARLRTIQQYRQTK